MKLNRLGAGLRSQDKCKLYLFIFLSFSEPPPPIEINVELVKNSFPVHRVNEKRDVCERSEGRGPFEYAVVKDETEHYVNQERNEAAVCDAPYRRILRPADEEMECREQEEESQGAEERDGPELVARCVILGEYAYHDHRQRRVKARERGQHENRAPSLPVRMPSVKPEAEREKRDSCDDEAGIQEFRPLRVALWIAQIAYPVCERAVRPGIKRPGRKDGNHEDKHGGDPCRAPRPPCKACIVHDS